MTIQELALIIQEALEETEDDVKDFAEKMQKGLEITIQVMDVLQDIILEMRTRDLTNALLVHKIVDRVRESEEQA